MRSPCCAGPGYVNPVMYLPHDTEPDIIYVFESKGGAPTNPDWCRNLTAAGDGSGASAGIPRAISA